METQKEKTNWENNYYQLQTETAYRLSHIFNAINDIAIYESDLGDFAYYALQGIKQELDSMAIELTGRNCSSQEVIEEEEN